MANSYTNNVLLIDTAGAAVTTITFPIKVLAIDFIASADTWSAIILDASGGTALFRADSSIANQRNFYKYYGVVQVKSLYPGTLTNITYCLVYYTGVGT